MKRMLHTYFSHPNILIYFFLLFLMLTFCMRLRLWETHFLYFILPLFITPVFEWVTHKYVLHRIVSKEAPRAFAYQKILHYNHHLAPDELRWIFAPLSGAVAIFLFIFMLFGLIGGSPKAGLASMTFAIGYFLYYEWVHLGHHLPSYGPRTSYGRLLKKAHQWHHYSNENYWWGITSHLADLLFRTFPDPKKVPHSPHVRDISKSEQAH